MLQQRLNARYKPVAKNIGARISHYRQEKGLTQQELAQLVFVSRVTITHYEVGRCSPPLPTLITIAQVLGRSLSDFEV